MLKPMILPLLAIATLAAPLPVQAAKKSFIVDGGLMQALGSDALSVGSGVAMGNSFTSGFGFNIVMPKGYKKNSPVTLQVRLSVNVANCSVVFVPVSVLRTRPGFVQSSNGGITANGPAIIPVPSVENQVFTKSFTLRRASSGAIVDQKADDHLYVHFNRAASLAEDTCDGSMRATSVKVIYTVD
jgi:hypothetical protein